MNHVGKLDIQCLTHQCHDVVSEIPRQIRGNKTRQAC